MSRRSVTLIVAFVLAGIAAVAIYSYVTGVEDEAFKDAEPVEVFVAKEQINQGVGAETAQQQGLIGKDTLPRKAVLAGAILSLDEIRGKVATTSILKGEQIVAQ